MVSCGQLNKMRVEKLQRADVNAVGLSGIDGRVFEGMRKDPRRIRVDVQVVEAMLWHLAETGRPSALVNSGGARYSESMDRDELVRVLQAFETTGLEYVLIGATAMGFHGVVRATEDVDLFIRATPENVERLRQALRSAYAGDPHIGDIRAEDLLGEYPAVRYYPPSGDLFFDVMTRLGEAVGFETVEAEVKDFEGIRVPVATPRALYRLKKDTVRPLDRQDAAALRDRFNLTDED